ncbi:transmembrane protein, putative [Medicago truncatula]|uniref:Transmembrane protein, putative n=1 Tax=Medicago truncatula TaxID=3880 RepID=G7KGY4_MEDTR|nr:transmembrane protein, putative [Medicago truncatula]
MRNSMMFLFCFASQMLVYYFIPSTAAALSLSSQTDKLALKEKLTNGVPDSLPSWNELYFCEWGGEGF